MTVSITLSYSIELLMWKIPSLCYVCDIYVFLEVKFYLNLSKMPLSGIRPNIFPLTGQSDRFVIFR